MIKWVNKPVKQPKLRWMDRGSLADRIAKWFLVLSLPAIGRALDRAVWEYYRELWGG